MEQNDLETKVVLLEKTVESLTKAIDIMQKKIDTLERNYYDGRIQYTEMNSKLDTLIDKMTKMENRVETVDNKSKIDWVQIVTLGIVGFVSGIIGSFLNKFFGK